MDRLSTSDASLSPWNNLLATVQIAAVVLYNNIVRNPDRHGNERGALPTYQLTQPFPSIELAASHFRNKISWFGFPNESYWMLILGTDA
jgi:hypothetical protein